MRLFSSSRLGTTDVLARVAGVRVERSAPLLGLCDWEGPRIGNHRTYVRWKCTGDLVMSAAFHRDLWRNWEGDGAVITCRFCLVTLDTPDLGSESNVRSRRGEIIYCLSMPIETDNGVCRSSWLIPPPISWAAATAGKRTRGRTGLPYRSYTLFVLSVCWRVSS